MTAHSPVKNLIINEALEKPFINASLTVSRPMIDMLQITRVFIPADIISKGQIPRNGLTLGPDHGSGGEIIT